MKSGPPIPSMLASNASNGISTLLYRAYSLRIPSSPPSRLAPFVGDENEQRVVETSDLPEVVDDTPDLLVGVGHEAGEDFLHAGVDAFPVVRERCPGGDAGVALRQPHRIGHDAERFLARQYLVSFGVPAVIEHAPVGVGVLEGNVMRRVARTVGEIQEERLGRIRDVGAGHVLDGAIGEVDAQVIAVAARHSRRIDCPAPARPGASGPSSPSGTRRSARIRAPAASDRRGRRTSARSPG